MSLSSIFYRLFSHLNIIPITLYQNIIPYFNKLIHMYGYNLSILSLKYRMPNNCTIANLGHQVSKSRLRPTWPVPVYILTFLQINLIILPLQLFMAGWPYFYTVFIIYVMIALITIGNIPFIKDIQEMHSKKYLVTGTLMLQVLGYSILATPIEYWTK